MQNCSLSIATETSPTKRTQQIANCALAVCVLAVSQGRLLSGKTVFSDYTELSAQDRIAAKIPHGSIIQGLPMNKTCSGEGQVNVKI